MPEKYQEERGRVLDAYADGHKYVMEARAAVYGEEDFVVGLASFLNEIGVIPVICASGGHSGELARKIAEVIPDFSKKGVQIVDDSDFAELTELVRNIRPDFLVGNSKGYSVSRKFDIPLIRVGFPIHDRLTGARILHVGYRGAQQLFDRITDTLLDRRQESTGIGYSYM
jgi:nitrogenase molybdenum-iron protein NifN